MNDPHRCRAACKCPTSGYYGSGTTHDYLNHQGAIAYTPEIGHNFWESPDLICDRIQEMLPAMKYMSWIAGSYSCFQNFQLPDTDRIWVGEEINLGIRVKNKGLSKTATNVNIQIGTDHPAIVAVNASSMIGDLAPRTFGDNYNEPNTFIVLSPLSVGEQITFTVQILQEGVISYTDEIHLYAGERTILFEDDGD